MKYSKLCPLKCLECFKSRNAKVLKIPGVLMPECPK